MKNKRTPFHTGQTGSLANFSNLQISLSRVVLSKAVLVLDNDNDIALFSKLWVVKREHCSVLGVIDLSFMNGMLLRLHTIGARM
mmetsp:Transcript_13784/g.19755  ORF Transcript_13784/g.19755 Transcript_13784/m.19755 type:complete len:84 (+) Transcript_13784:1192-1443(+)